MNRAKGDLEKTVSIPRVGSRTYSRPGIAVTAALPTAPGGCKLVETAAWPSWGPAPSGRCRDTALAGPSASARNRRLVLREGCEQSTLRRCFCWEAEGAGDRQLLSRAKVCYAIAGCATSRSHISDASMYSNCSGCAEMNSVMNGPNGPAVISSKRCGR